VAGDSASHAPRGPKAADFFFKLIEKKRMVGIGVAPLLTTRFIISLIQKCA
jgi:hypothetical protein